MDPVLKILSNLPQSQVKTYNPDLCDNSHNPIEMFIMAGRS